MKGALRHPLVAGLLAAIGGMAQAFAGLGHVEGLRAADLRIDSLKPRAVYPVSIRNGSARVRRAAVKARNVARNRRAHRG